MDFSKRHNITLSYRWRLFFPIVGMMWLVLIVLVLYHYKREMDYRANNIRGQLTLITNQILDAHENNNDISRTLQFIRRYYENSELDEVLVSVYDYKGKLIESIGQPIFRNHLLDPLTTEVSDSLINAVSAADAKGSVDDHPSPMFYFSEFKSADGLINVHTAMPYTGTLSAALSTSPSFWLTIFIIALATTVMAYYSTKLMSRSVTMLKKFSEELESTHNGNIDMPNFPHDELGDISRRIIQLYREKYDAITRSERQHQIALNAINEKSRVKRELTNNLNHELKTPIGVIRGYIDTILSTPDMDDETRTRFLQRAQQNVNRLCTMFEDVSTMTRLEEAGAKIPLTDINFHDLLFTLENDMNDSGIYGDMEFSYDVPINCHVRGNSTLLSGMISNLAKNASIHSHGTKMGVKLVIESPQFYTFAFWDNGNGVDNINLPRLFERFYRIDAGRSRKEGGTGLGLPIVKNTVEAHGGTIGVHNRAEGGLEFLFTLPKWTGAEGKDGILNVKKPPKTGA